MSKEIKDYLHLYLGCECMVGDKIGKVTAVQSKPFIQAIWRNNEDSRQGHFVNAELIKPILRPLSDMTEEENAKAGDKPDTVFIAAAQIKYLLSINIDLFGLIESGLAIDKTIIL